MIEVKKREGETTNALLFRFTTRVKRSGVLKEKNKRRFRHRPANRRARRLSALHREHKRLEVTRARKLGIS